ncbi:MAG: hypothetical protein JRH15_14315, partial [Deltaproteobacteria bacterium]|nr:hypothetical protein [Deltaproteobacteria bacterium]
MKNENKFTIPDSIKEILESITMPSLLHGCGCSTEDLSKHRIGIANTWSEL